jgi:PiT family inorganic phosphate transporter
MRGSLRAAPAAAARRVRRIDAELASAVALALAYALTNGLHDAANAIATLVATRAARPGQAVLLAAAFSLLGPVVVGGAVAGTIARVVEVPDADAVPVVGAALAAAVVLNLATWWRGLPSSSGHALVGGLAGAALAGPGAGAVNWGGFDGHRPVGVLGTFAALAAAPVLGALAAFLAVRVLRRALRRATRRVRGPLRAGQWAMASWLALSHGSNDAQKAVGVIAALLLARGKADSLAAPLWAVLASGAALTAGTAMGGWSIVRTIGRRIYQVRPLDSFASQASSAGVILAASLLGAPVSTTHVVASSVVGVGGGRRRFRHVHWELVRAIGIAWLTTVPATAGLGAAACVAWRSAG